MEKRVQEVLEQIKNSASAIFSENLTGIYLHGSLALGCFHWNSSDIDFIVVLETAPTLPQKVQLIQALLKINALCPPKGLEMSLVLEQYTQDFLYPTPFELHFSRTYKQQCAEQPEAFCRRMQGTDKDLAAHFTVIRAAGITLCGKPAKEVFGAVPGEAYLDSIKTDVKNARMGILADPVYVILNLCRVLAYIREGLILSKKDGGAWGIRNAPGQDARLIRAALESYGGGSPFAAEQSQLSSFAQKMCQQIFQEEPPQ